MNKEKTAFNHTERRTELTHKGEVVKLGQGNKICTHLPSLSIKAKTSRTSSFNQWTIITQKNDRYRLFQNQNYLGTYEHLFLHRIGD